MERYYHVRDPYNNQRPMITICLLENKYGDVSRGVAICSPGDNPCKKTGREIALARARKANGLQQDSDKGFSQTRANMIEVDRIFTLNEMSIVEIFRFYTYKPKLTKFENKLLYGE